MTLLTNPLLTPLPAGKKKERRKKEGEGGLNGGRGANYMSEWNPEDETEPLLAAAEDFLIHFAVNARQSLGEQLVGRPTEDERFMGLVIDQLQVLQFYLPEEDLSAGFAYPLPSTNAFVTFCRRVRVFSPYARYLAALTAWVLARAELGAVVLPGNPFLCAVGNQFFQPFVPVFTNNYISYSCFLIEEFLSPFLQQPSSSTSSASSSTSSAFSASASAAFPFSRPTSQSTTEEEED